MHAINSELKDKALLSPDSLSRERETLEARVIEIESALKEADE